MTQIPLAYIQGWFEHQFNEIKDQIRLITASGLATALRPIISTTNHSHGMYAYPV